VFIESKDDGGGGDNWSCKSCKLQSNHHRQQTNIQLPKLTWGSSSVAMPLISPLMPVPQETWI